MDANITVQLNGQSIQASEGQTLSSFLQKEGMSTPYSAIARNEVIIPRHQFSQVFLQSGDRIEVIEPVGGG